MLQMLKRVGYKLSLIGFISIQVFILYKYSHYTHYDEWVGRGLYPGLAMFSGEDLYEPKTGPHITSYGWGTALFYSISGFADNPKTAINIAYNLNIISTIIVIILILIYTNYSRINKEIFKSQLIHTIPFIFIYILTYDKVTICITKIHADMPAFIFLTIAVIIFIYNHQRITFTKLLLISLFLCLSFWSKLPTLPAILFPFIYLLTFKHYSLLIKYILALLIALILTLFIPSFFYGFDDLSFYLFNHHNTGAWSDRYNLFNGENARLIKMGYFDAIPLMIRYMVLYLQEYWFILIPNIFSILYSFYIQSKSKVILFIFPLIYFLTLPSCLSALAHWGGVANSLFITNAFGMTALLVFLFFLLKELLSQFKYSIFLYPLVILLSLPVLRTSLIAPDPDNSPHQQAYNYLMQGNTDVYFAWYPLSHYFSQNKSLTSIEIPIWVGMQRPTGISFSDSHFPKGSKYLATCLVGYGSVALRPYLGKMNEVPSKNELSQWRLFEVEGKNQKDEL